MYRKLRSNTTGVVRLYCQSSNGNIKAVIQRFCSTGQRLQMLAVVLNWSWHICTFLYQKYLEKVSSIKTDASEFFNTKFGKFVYSLKEIGSSCYSYTYVYKYIYSYICIKMCISIYHMFKIRVMLFFRSKALYYLTDFSKI